MAGGDFAHRSVIKTRDEIGSLSATFNHMALQADRVICF